MAFNDTETPPGAYPEVTHRRKINKETKKVATNITSKSLGFKSTTMDRVKSYFQYYSKKEQVVKSRNSRWKNFWFRKKQQVIQQSNTSNTVAVGTVFSLSVPITISSHHYSKEETTRTSSRTSSIVQQLVILPPLQVYGFLFLAILFLLVIAFALVEVHRMISILELSVHGLKYVLVASVTNFFSLTSRIKSWF